MTINDYSNYGNRLQNYATQEVLKNIGFNVKTIINITKNENKNSQSNQIMYKIQKIKHMSFSEIFKKVNTRIWNYIHAKEINKCKTERIKAFKEFTQKIHRRNRLFYIS